MVWYYICTFLLASYKFSLAKNQKIRINIIFQQQEDYSNKGKKGQVFYLIILDKLPKITSSKLL